jgi:hypothetical protein
VRAKPAAATDVVGFEASALHVLGAGAPLLALVCNDNKLDGTWTIPAKDAPAV